MNELRMFARAQICCRSIVFRCDFISLFLTLCIHAIKRFRLICFGLQIFHSYFTLPNIFQSLTLCTIQNPLMKRTLLYLSIPFEREKKRKITVQCFWSSSHFVGLFVIILAQRRKKAMNFVCVRMCALIFIVQPKEVHGTFVRIICVP